MIRGNYVDLVASSAPVTLAGGGVLAAVGGAFATHRSSRLSLELRYTPADPAGRLLINVRVASLTPDEDGTDPSFAARYMSLRTTDPASYAAGRIDLDPLVWRFPASTAGVEVRYLLENIDVLPGSWAVVYAADEHASPGTLSLSYALARP